MEAPDNQPNWEEIGEKFDVWLPQIAPVGEALLQKLDTQAGDTVLDIACGTGEPALTLARKMKDQVHITGIDVAKGMIEVAQQKVIEEKLERIVFEVMPAEDMEFIDSSFHRVLCRFGVMFFKEPISGLKEIYRVLMPGGTYALAVWGSAASMHTLRWAYEVFKNKIETEFYPPLDLVTSLGDEKVLSDLLSEAGFSDIKIDSNTTNYTFDSFDIYWDTVETSDILKIQFEKLPHSERDIVRDQVRFLAKEFIVDEKLIIPHGYLIASGSK